MGSDSADDVGRGRPRHESVGWNAFTTLISGLLLGLGAGWALSRWTGSDLMYPVGLLGGVALGMYAIWAKYLRQ
jgi:F0F1-type ATP synthase assembly protein I